MAQSQHPTPTFRLQLSLERRVVADVVKAVVHAILFHRVFGNVRPQEYTILDVPYVTVNSKAIQQQVDEKVKTFDSMLQSDMLRGSGEISVEMQEKRAKKAWFAKTEDMCWEKWIIAVTTCNASNEREFLQLKANMARQLLDTFQAIIRTVSEHKDHIPPITTNDPNPFPFQIELPMASDSWGSMFKRMLES
ncbi:hypothetical protein H4R35_004895 [Dimargaris xerosporica]|nr:hypothetical protein H4R35_004895 [Dimargaris xerosporica]